MKKLISRRNFLKAAALAGSAVTLTACGGSKANTPVANEQGVVESTEQTSFTIIGGQSALSPGYAELNKLTEMIKFSSIIVAAAPMLIIYPFVQKYFEKGFMAGAVKG